MGGLVWIDQRVAAPVVPIGGWPKQVQSSAAAKCPGRRPSAVTPRPQRFVVDAAYPHFRAGNLRESLELCHEEWLRDDLAGLKSRGVALWDGKAPLRSRYATQAEKAIFLEAAGEPTPDEMVLAYLIKLDAETI
jgi:hypothetical protein